MNTRGAVFLSLFFGVAGCQSAGPSGPDVTAQFEPADRPAVPQYDWQPSDSPRKPSKPWTGRNSFLDCDGFLTRQESQDFCATEAPSDWSPFEFQGETYYVQPLAGGVDSESGEVPAPDNLASEASSTVSSLRGPVVAMD